MVDVAPASLANARILDEIMNDGDEEAMRQLDIDIHEEVCLMFLHFCFVVAKFLSKVAKAPTQPRAYLQPRSRRGRNTEVAANNAAPSIYPDYYKGPVSLHLQNQSVCCPEAYTILSGTY